MPDIGILDREMLRGLGMVVAAMDRTVRAGGEKVVTSEETGGEGADELGAYTSSTCTMREQFTNGEGKTQDKLIASFEVRTYADLALAVVHVSAFLPWGLGTFVPEGSVRLEFDSIPGITGLLGLHMVSDWWSAPHFDMDLSKLPPRTQMLLWEIGGEEYGCIVPLVSNGYRCDLNARTGKPGADLTSHDVGQNRCNCAAFVIGLGDDPYEMARRCFAAGMTASGRPGRMRWEKDYPEPFEYIGWCTWNALYTKVNERDILRQLKAFRRSKFPMRFLLIDDGWSPVENGQLASFGIDKKKFPRGLKALTDEAREQFDIPWVGMWHTFTGYWGGVFRGSEAYCQAKEHIFESKRDTPIPYPDLSKGVGFWHTWHSWMRGQGVSFVKVDNQGSLYQHTLGSMKVGDAVKGEQYALQASVDLNLSGWVLNCMSQNIESAWHWINSNVARTSDDFWPGGLESSNRHILQNAYNSLMFGNLCWPDWDMWWSEHPRAKFHAAMRAISGGPVYVADEVGKTDFSVMWPLVFSDGKLLRCDEPAMVTRDSLFSDPSANPVPVKVWNTIGDSGVLGAFYATEKKQPVKGTIRPSDVEGIQGERFAVREFFSGETRVLGRDEAWEFELEPYGQMLWAVVPIEDGTAVIGLADKYVSPAAVEAQFRDGNMLAVELYEGGDFLAYLEQKPKSVTVDGAKARYKYDGGWLSVKTKSGLPVVVTIGM